MNTVISCAAGTNGGSPLKYETETTKDKLIRCECGYVIFDGTILKARFVVFDKGHTIAHCRRCKREIVITGIKKI